MQDHFNKLKNRPERQLLDLDPEVAALVNGSSTLSEILNEADAYYKEISGEFGKHQS